MNSTLLRMGICILVPVFVSLPNGSSIRAETPKQNIARQNQQKQQLKMKQRQQAASRSKAAKAGRVKKHTYAIRNRDGKTIAVKPSANQSTHQYQAALKALRATSRDQNRQKSTVKSRLQNRTSTKPAPSPRPSLASRFMNGLKHTLFGPRSVRTEYKPGVTGPARTITTHQYGPFRRTTDITH